MTKGNTALDNNDTELKVSSQNIVTDKFLKVVIVKLILFCIEVIFISNKE